MKTITYYENRENKFQTWSEKQEKPPYEPQYNHNPNRTSERELELLNLIDEHIVRLSQPAPTKAIPIHVPFTL